MTDPAILAIVNALNRTLTTNLIVEVQSVQTLATEGAANLDNLAAAIAAEAERIDAEELPYQSASTDGGLQVTWLAREQASGESTRGAIPAAGD